MSEINKEHDIYLGTEKDQEVAWVESSFKDENEVTMELFTTDETDKPNVIAKFDISIEALIEIIEDFGGWKCKK